MVESKETDLERLPKSKMGLTFGPRKVTGGSRTRETKDKGETEGEDEDQGKEQDRGRCDQRNDKEFV